MADIVQQIQGGDYAGVAASAGSATLDVILWIVIAVMIASLIGLLIYILRFKIAVRIRYVTKEGSYIIDDKAARKQVDGVTTWRLLKTKIDVSPPPKESINITKKGKLVAECYITEDNPEPVWLTDNRDLDLAGFKPLTTAQRSLTVARIRKAQSRLKKSLWEQIQQIVLPATMIIMVALPFVFWGDITAESRDAMAQAGNIAAQNAEISEQNARILSVLAGKVEAGDLVIKQTPPDAATSGGAT